MSGMNDYKRYRADLYYIEPSGEDNDNGGFRHSPAERMKQFLSIPDEQSAIQKALAFAQAHPNLLMSKLCVITSFYLKKTDYNYRTDYQWYQWRGSVRKFEKDEYQKDVHW